MTTSHSSPSDSETAAATAPTPSSDDAGEEHWPAPIYRTGCLDEQRFGDGTCDEILRVFDWMREADGRPSLGAIALLADSATGFAVSTRLPRHLTLVTAQLRIETFRSVAPDVRVLRGDAEALHVDDDVGFARALIADEGGRALAMASMRSAHAPAPEVRPEVAPVAIGQAFVVLPDASADELLDARVTAASDLTSEVTVRARPDLTNAAGNVHGGLLAMSAERALLALLDQIDSRQTFQPIDLEVTYLRPIPGDGATATVVGRVAARTRRFLHLVADVVRPDGRTAASVRSSYIHRPPDGRATPDHVSVDTE